MQTILLSGNDEPFIREIFAVALDDHEGSLRYFAALGASRVNDQQLLPRIVSMLESNILAERLVATQALSEYGSSVVAYMDKLQTALDRETDTIVRDRLRGIIDKLRGRR